MFTFARSMAGAIAACVLTAGVITGCSDNAASPLPPDSDPLGNNATVETSDPVSQPEATDVRNNVRKNANDSIAVEPTEAADKAREEYPGCEVYSVTLDYDADSANYEVVVKQNGKYYIVVVDPQTGDVVDKHEIDEEHVSHITVIVIRPVNIKVKEAREKGKKLVNGDCVESNLEEIDGKPTYVIIILTPDNRYVTLYIDADSGKERKLSDEGKCGGDEDGHKNKRGRGHYRHGNGKGYGHRWHCHCDCTDDNGNPLPDSVITIDSARTITGMMLDSATIDTVRLDTSDSTHMFYEVRFSRDSSRYVVKLDAKTGKMIEAEQTAGRFDSTSYEFIPYVPGDTLVALSVARTAAIAQVIGVVQGWKLSYSTADAKWIYTFTIKETATSTTKKVVVDAKTGMFMRIE
jgi:uncharacterized membrane protein YkoI